MHHGASGESLVYGADGQLKWHDTTVLKQVVTVFGSNLGSNKVDSGEMSSVSFFTEWPGSDVIMTLITPSGRVLNRNSQADDITHENGLTYEYYTIYF